MTSQKKKDETTAAPDSGGHNAAVADAADRRLFFHHKRRLRLALADLATATANVRNVKKRAKAEIGDEAAADLTYSLKLDKEGGEAVAVAEMRRHVRIMRWMNLGPHQQGDFFIDNVNPNAEFVQSHERGVIAALNGDLEETNPYPEASQDALQWAHGYEAGRKEYHDWLNASEAEERRGAVAGGDEGVEGPGPDEDDKP